MCHKSFLGCWKCVFRYLCMQPSFIRKNLRFFFLLHCHPLSSSFFYRNIPSEILEFNCLRSNLNLLLSFLGRPQNTCPIFKSESSRFFNCYMLYKNSTNWKKFHYVILEKKIFLDVFHYVILNLLAMFADMYACTYVIMWFVWTYLHLKCFSHMLYEHILSKLNISNTISTYFN